MTRPRHCATPRSDTNDPHHLHPPAGRFAEPVGAVVITFMLSRALHGDPAAYFVGSAATQEAAAQVRAQLGLDRSLPEQFDHMGWAILNAAGLSFIGLGVCPPEPEWGILAQHCDLIIVMHAGHAVEWAPTAQLFAAPRLPGTARLMGSTPGPTSSVASLPAVPGLLPDLRRSGLCARQAPPYRHSATGTMAACHFSA